MSEGQTPQMWVPYFGTGASLVLGPIILVLRHNSDDGTWTLNTDPMPVRLKARDLESAKAEALQSLLLQLADATQVVTDVLGGLVYPRYQMKVNGRTLWCSLREAAQHYDNGFVPVEFGDYVAVAVGANCRAMTSEDRMAISGAADDYSSDK